MWPVFARTDNYDSSYGSCVIYCMLLCLVAAYIRPDSNEFFQKMYEYVKESNFDIPTALNAIDVVSDASLVDDCSRGPGF